MSNISQWSTSAASNNSAPPDGFPEGQAPSTVNDCAREVMAAVARQFQDSDGSLVTTGTGTAYTLITNNSNAALADIGLFVFRAHTTNTGAATLAVDGLTAKSIEADSSALVAGDLVQDSLYLVAYNGTNDTFDLLNARSATASASIDHDATTNFVANEHIDHTSVTITAGSGLSYSVGGTDISADATIDVDVTGLTQADATDIGGGDEFLLNDGGTNKAVRWQDFGIPQTDDTSTAPFSAADLTYANRWYNCNNASAISAVIPANASIAYPVGTTFAFHQRGAGQVTVSVTTDTLRAPNGAKTAVQYSTIFATKIAATEWVITGDTAP